MWLHNVDMVVSFCRVCGSKARISSITIDFISKVSCILCNKTFPFSFDSDLLWKTKLYVVFCQQFCCSLSCINDVQYNSCPADKRLKMDAVVSQALEHAKVK